LHNYLTATGRHLESVSVARQFDTSVGLQMALIVFGKASYGTFFPVWWHQTITSESRESHGDRLTTPLLPRTVCQSSSLHESNPGSLTLAFQTFYAQCHVVHIS